MEKLRIITRGEEIKTNKNLEQVITFLRNPEDRIDVLNGETVNIEVYNNGELIFFGDKHEFFNKLTQ